MISSMTGYGRSDISADHISVFAEIKTVNHRFSEISLRIPRQLMPIEDKIKKVIAGKIQRGRIEVYITVEGEQPASRKVSTDWELADSYIDTLKEMKQRYGIQSPLDLSHILQFPQIIEFKEAADVHEGLEVLTLNAVSQAADSVVLMRRTEGAQLQKDLLLRLSEMEQSTKDIAELAPRVVEAYRERLSRRLEEFLGNAVDENRLLTEAAIFADRADITEELIRLQSHVQQFQETLHWSEPVGRKLDFIVQEMNREANTIGSKANDNSISSLVVHLKSIIEKVKEQVQNIE
ncbi:YicC family protein [Bacillus lacus]|uniref:YicC family protein n=1 Tax=Metabacillus lacus TaxID=1983721 RepID=A0A7X2J142_9BACI|nr:YicC/YloC family endoribonuclease [Metabacillus lacus]MRX73344.1 YicC family protein [Metabacillus lacus]